MTVSIAKMQTVELSGLSSLTSAVYSLESLSTVSHTQTSILTARKSPKYRPECSANLRYRMPTIEQAFQTPHQEEVTVTVHMLVSPSP